jgi:hypothetical protein
MLKIFDDHVVMTFDTYRCRRRLVFKRKTQYRCDIDQRHARRGNHSQRREHTQKRRLYGTFNRFTKQIRAKVKANLKTT